MPQRCDGENLMTAIRNYLDPHFDALENALQDGKQIPPNNKGAPAVQVKVACVAFDTQHMNKQAVRTDRNYLCMIN